MISALRLLASCSRLSLGRSLLAAIQVGGSLAPRPSPPVGQWEPAAASPSSSSSSSSSCCSCRPPTWREKQISDLFAALQPAGPRKASARPQVELAHSSPGLRGAGCASWRPLAGGAAASNYANAAPVQTTGARPLGARKRPPPPPPLASARLFALSLSLPLLSIPSLSVWPEVGRQACAEA